MIYLFFASVIFAYFLTIFVRRVLFKYKILDYPDGARKVHSNAVIRGGGIAIFAVFLLVALSTGFTSSNYLSFYAGALIMFIVGVIDDIYDIKPSHKLIGQIVAVVVAMSLGLKIEFVNGPGDSVMDIGLLSYPLTFLWLLGITNAINLIDGLDGLAGGVGAISAIVLGIVALDVGRTEVAILAFVLAASAIGFLPHNFSKKRKMFMGDSGSQFLGFSLAALSILGITKVAAVFTMLAPVMILAIPIFDTLFAIVRRTAKRQPIHIADRGHLHHRLLDMGFTEKKAVIFIYYITILLGLVSIYTTKIPPKNALIIFIVTVAVIIGLSYALSLNHKKQKV